MATSPNTDNLSIPTGIVYIMITGVDVALRDVGECSVFSVERSEEKKEYVSVRDGIGIVVKSVSTKSTMTAKWTMNEITPENLAPWAGGTAGTDTSGNPFITGRSQSNQVGFIRVVGTNDNGPRLQFDAAIQITPTGSLSLLAQDNDFQDLPLEAAVTDETWTFLTTGGTA